MDWARILNRALDYIEVNLADGRDLTCSSIANYAYISGAHLQRSFHCFTGLTISEYVRNRRLSLAGQELAAGRVKVIDAALKYGYETPESFSKAFSRFHGVSPAQARKNGATLKSYNRLTVKIIMEGGSVMDYRIENREAFDAVVMARSFGEDAKAAVPSFWDEYFNKGLHKTVPPTMGVCGWHEPGSGNFKYGIGCEAASVNGVPDGFEIWPVPENTWAVFRCVGAMPGAIGDMWTRIYGEWLPHAQYELAPSCDFEYYTDGDTASPDYVSEIWVPVKKK